MKVFLPVIIGYVPKDMVKCLGSFLEACYITWHQDIDMKALDCLDNVLDQFKKLQEVFQVPGIRAKGFSLPCMHSIFHYHHQIEDFGAPGGLCSSITESRHITAIKRPWRRLNKYEALGQMLLINQQLDKLIAMCGDFCVRGMLPSVHTAGVPHVNDGEGDKEDGPVEENVLGHVSLAWC
jgi:hypothetical protein